VQIQIAETEGWSLKMTNKNAEQQAHETLRALIAGGCFPKGLISSTGDHLVKDPTRLL
jgi:hypothetical protein